MNQPAGDRLLVYGVIVAGCATLAAILARPEALGGTLPLLSVVFLALAIALQRVELAPLRGVRVSGEVVAVLLSFLVGGPGVAVIVALCSAVVLQLRLRTPLLGVLFAPARLILAIGAFTAVYHLAVGPDFGIVAPGRALDGDLAMWGRYLGGTALGAALYAALSRALSTFTPGRPRAEWRRRALSAGSATLGALLFLPVLLALTFAIAELGTVTIIFILPAGAVVWGVAVLVRARLSRQRLSVALRLSAFFTAAVGTVFVLLSGLVLGVFSLRYTEAVVTGQELLGRSTVLTLEEVVRRGESLRLSLVPKATLERLLEQSPDLAYAALHEIRDGERRQILVAVRPDVESFRGVVERQLESTAAAGRHRWQQDGRVLSAENLVIPVLGPSRTPVAELHLGIDLETAAARIRELGLLLGGATLLLFAVLLLLLRHYAGQGLVKPLHQIGGALERIARGNADLSDRLEVTGDQEIYEVAAHFNSFADRLVEMIETTRATARQNAELFEQQKETTERLQVQAEELEGAYDQLRRSQEQLLVSEKMAALGKLTAGIAHEINSPLGGILNSLELAKTYAEEYRSSVRDDEVTPEDHEAIAGDLLDTLRTATAATQKVAQFVHTIKGQTRTGEERMEPFDPALEIEATLVLLRHEFKHRRVAVNTELQPGLLITGEPGKFGLLVQNLVSNAADAYGAAEEEPAVWIRLRGEGEVIVLEVEDHGSGIPEEIRGRIFDYMFTTKDVGKGTGLGLSMVYSVVTGHFAGELDLDTEMGRGTVFRVRIPTSVAAREAALRSEEDPPVELRARA